MAARTILDNPPPLTPRALRNYPYAVRVFPYAVLLHGARLTRELSTREPAPRPATPSRVE